MKIKDNLLTINEYSRPGKKLSQVKGVVVHYVANPGSSAVANRNYFENLKSGKSGVYASAHYIIGLDGEVIKCVPTGEMAYHVGSKTYKAEAVKKLSSYPNDCTIGIECCHPDSTGKPTKATRDALVELLKTLCEAFELDAKKDVYLHHDITGKLCHKYYVENPKEWVILINDVGIDKVYVENINYLNKKGIIASPDVWYDPSNVKKENIVSLINKISLYVKNEPC